MLASPVEILSRFLCYVAEDRARQLHRPQPNEVELQGLIKQFSLLSHLRGPFAWTPESETLFDQSQSMSGSGVATSLMTGHAAG
jgi:hypothetical protein